MKFDSQGIESKYFHIEKKNKTFTEVEKDKNRIIRYWSLRNWDP